MNSRRRKTIKIYTLTDPMTLENRYIGKTKQLLRRRLAKHVRSAMKGYKDHKSNWIRSLLAMGKKPKIKQLQIVPEAEWIKAEQHWIKKFRKAGCKLTNLTDGGEGCLGMKMSEEAKEKLRAAQLLITNRKLTDEHKRNIARGMHRRFRDTEERRRIGESVRKTLQKKREENGGVLTHASPSEEGKANMSEAMKRRWRGFTMPEEEKRNRENAAAKRRGVSRPEEVRRKISEALKGRRRSTSDK